MSVYEFVLSDDQMSGILQSQEVDLSETPLSLPTLKAALRCLSDKGQVTIRRHAGKIIFSEDKDALGTKDTRARSGS